jgi:hypothetical protein
MSAPIRPRRALRTVLATGAAVVTAGLAHRVGQGTVDVGGAVWAFAVLLGPACWLAGRERGWICLALTQLAGQQIAHLALNRSDAHELLPADLMLYAHLAAAALTAVWLRVGERRAFAAVRCLAAAVLGHCTIRVEPPDTGASPAVPPAPGRRPVGRCLRHALVRRGPPLPA